MALAAVCGGAIGLAFEALLIRLLKPVLPAALPAAGLRPWLWALGALVLISLLVGLRPSSVLATQPLRVLRRDVVASVWPLRYFLPVTAAVVVALLVTLMGASTLLWAILGGMAVLALLLGGIGWGSLLLLRRITLKSLRCGWRLTACCISG